MDKTTQKIEAQPAPTSTMAAQIHIPGYEILRELGHGGMAHVYLAVQESFGREVALKVLSPHLADDEQFSKRFLREARIVSQLNHPNIVTVYDAGKHEQHHYMSMEYIPGKDLKQLKDSISREEAIRIIKDVAAALDFAGKKGIVHRDVKPENIMVHKSDNRVILMDFGIAHGCDVTQGMTQTGKAIGTPHFMSPEQTKGVKVDHRSDIYSLGVVLFQLLAGYLPFDADSAVAVGIKHLTAPIPLLPGGLEVFQPIINRCLSKQPQHRYQKAAELIDALNKITEEQIENINTQAVIFKDAGADSNAETQIGDVPRKPRRKNPDIVFPSNSQKKINEKSLNLKQNNTRRNLLFILFLSSAIWFADQNRNMLVHYWGHEIFPQIVKAYPNIIPESYRQKIVQQERLTITPKTIKQSKREITAQPNKQVLSTDTTSQPIIQTTTETPPKKADKKISRIIELKNKLTKQPESVIELVVIYKDMISQSKDVSVAHQGLKELREWHINQISVAFASENASLARQHIELMKQNFPKATESKRFIRLEKKVAFLERINLHLDKAENYFKTGALSKPINRNAINEINTILNLAPNNDNAKNFIGKIVQSYIEKTTQLQQQGNIHNAILMVEEGIAALNNNSTLINKRKELKGAIKHNKNISSLFKQAERYLGKDQLIKPQAYNAYDIYQKILEQEKNNVQAKAGLKTIHQRLAERMITTIKKGELKIAKEYLQASIKRYGKSSLFASVQLKLNDALDARAPKVETVKLSNLTITDLITKNSNKKIERVLKLNKILYIGFNFINFDPQTTWLDATLFDITKRTTVTRKPIVISSQLGEHFFDLTLENGFKNHQYKLELRLKNKVLASKLFRVKH